MPKDKKRILITLHCSKCGRNLEFDDLICVNPKTGSAQCAGFCGPAEKD